MSNTVPVSAWRSVLGVLKAGRSRAPLSPAQRERYEVLYPRIGNLAWNHSVLGYGIAEKLTDGGRTGEDCVRFYVRRKVHVQRLKGQPVIPKRIGYTSKGGVRWEIPTDVVELPRLPNAQRVLMPGDNLGHVSGTSGTLGVAVTGSTGRRFILTCAHVAAPVNARAGDAIESPADGDKLPGPNKVGSLFSFSQLSTTQTNQVDAALVDLAPGSGHRVSNSNLRLSLPPRFSSLSEFNFAQFRNRVVERFSLAAAGGSMNATAQGIIQSIGVDLLFNFGMTVPLRFSNVVEVAYTSSTAAGDSGAAIIDASTREVLGIHFAGIGNRGFFIMGSKIASLLQVVVAAG